MNEQPTPSDPGQEDRFDTTPKGWASRWQVEIGAAKKALEKWHATGVKINKRFLCEHPDKSDNETFWELFTANVLRLQALLYGQTPKVTASRRYQDARDDVGRVAGLIMDRMLNSDLERDGDNCATAYQQALQDRLLPGLGNVRVRYVVEHGEEKEGKPAMVDEETGKELAPEVPATQEVEHEDAEVDYCHWKDQLWSQTRVFAEVRWWSFSLDMTRGQLIKRFGKKLGRQVPLNAPRKRDDESEGKADPWSRAVVWEIWSKEHKKVFWYVDGFHSILDVEDDPLGLEGFWPFPRPLLANVSTSSLIPRPDYVLAADLYEQINTLGTRISMLEDAIRVAGVYDKTAGTLVEKLLTDKGNRLYPVDKWAAFAERGGLEGQIEYLPLEQIVAALAVLHERRAGVVEALYQVTGLSDIMRGQATAGGATATEQRAKVQFGSVMVQALQDEFARFASDVQRIRAEIISKHFDPATIRARSNADQMFEDPALVEQAIALIKSPEFCRGYRIEVKPEAISLQDFAAIKQERLEVLEGIGQFLQMTGPVAEKVPGSLPLFLQILQWAVAGLRGASSIEGVLDQAITAAKEQAEQPQQQPVDPKVQTEQLKQQGEVMKQQAALQKGQQDLQGDLVKINAEVQADAAREENQMRFNVEEHTQKQLITNALKPKEPPGASPGGPKR